MRVTCVFDGHFRFDRRIHVESWDVRFMSLDWTDADLLEVPFTEEEVCQEFMSADGNKTP